MPPPPCPPVLLCSLPRTGGSRAQGETAARGLHTGVSSITSTKARGNSVIDDFALRPSLGCVSQCGYYFLDRKRAVRCGLCERERRARGVGEGGGCTAAGAGCLLWDLNALSTNPRYLCLLLLLLLLLLCLLSASVYLTMRKEKSPSLNK